MTTSPTFLTASSSSSSSRRMSNSNGNNIKNYLKLRGGDINSNNGNPESDESENQDTVVKEEEGTHQDDDIKENQVDKETIEIETTIVETNNANSENVEDDESTTSTTEKDQSNKSNDDDNDENYDTAAEEEDEEDVTAKSTVIEEDEADDADYDTAVEEEEGDKNGDDTILAKGEEDEQYDTALEDEENVNEEDNDDESVIEHEEGIADDEEENEDGTILNDDNGDDGSVYEDPKEYASQLRLQGKELHDEGKWDDAAQTFYKASQLLESITTTGDNDITTTTTMMDEAATCRLHEALCRLKQEEYQLCIDACTDVITGGDNKKNNSPISGAIQARAHHRRAKAKLGLQDFDGALEDARNAAFLGDRKAVALYGRLMREQSGALSSSDDEDAVDQGSKSPMEDLFQGINPFMENHNHGVGGPSSPSSSSAALMESLLNKSNPMSSSSSSSSSPLGGLGDMASLMGGLGGLGGLMGAGGKNGGGGGGSLAKSVLSSLAKRLEDQSTQDMICRFMKNAESSQVQQLASTAGIPLSDNQASKLVNFAHGITPKGIQRTVKTSKRVWYGVTITRKTLAVIQKYKHIIVLVVLLGWIQSALMKPLPLPKHLRRAARKGATAAAAATATAALTAATTTTSTATPSSTTVQETNQQENTN